VVASKGTPAHLQLFMGSSILCMERQPVEV